MKKWLKAFAEDRRGVTSIEYALIAAFIAIAIIVAVGDVGNKLVNIFNNVKNGF
ncbi:MAG: Flp family type IVb pilin [Hyphomicrobiaceae bacterium]|nr:Flp family type IVb pilin [Hyphomicrobiaceae bacterium]